MNQKESSRLKTDKERDGKPWEDWELDLLRLDIKKDRLDIDKVVKDLKRSKEAVQAKVRAIKGKCKSSEEVIKEKYGVENVKKVLENLYFIKRMTVKEIADDIGISKDTLNYVFVKNKIEMNRAKKNSEKRGQGYVQVGGDRLLITGRFKKKGYTFLRIKDHPNASKAGLIIEHRAVMEQHLNRYLESWERVMRKNDDKSDNRPENLYIRVLERQKK
ncbi:hypothetical protein QTG56_22275 (plasmid) [Rossellomorea sp. AcN35-11]|nr:hypothetical protein [Rossellomorea aquimaris]WJV32104.1 hypothetical protein QTG56_22275 [Rossellomorea sp. AcN35-11]